MHTALSYSFAHFIHSDDDSKEGLGMVLSILEFILMIVVIGCIAL
jgi:hypothetical protein